MVHSTPNAAQINRTTPSSELAQVMAHPESFRLLYFPLDARGQTSRDLLIYGGANWEGVSPQQVVIPETNAIENYLAKHFGLMGDNEYEENLIRSFQCSSAWLYSNYLAAVVWNMPEVREKNLEVFKTKRLAHWVKTHERHLLENGNNDHYLGNKMSLADIRTANLINDFSLQPWRTELMEIISQAPALIKLKETVENDPKMHQWKNSDEAKKLAASTKAFFVDPIAAFGKLTA
ncbi:hypothetical protein BG015_007367 [Linnemannia schmuckeri]|uniref:GST C-terminal domain-containing protein n=1 Tax=Linnemannia schmuckeri TaxID=64567 RepID=A0A9P5VEP7_9FUNG|nr:hypothetical protein BG015_007367 [Linnemannia schmuckeri]